MQLENLPARASVNVVVKLKRLLLPSKVDISSNGYLELPPEMALISRNYSEYALAPKYAALLRDKDALLAEQKLLRSESNHRLLNGLQMVVSLLSLQSRAAATPDVAAQLAIAANRVGNIGRIHRRLHANDGTETVALRKYLGELCHDLSPVTSFDPAARFVFLVEGSHEVEVPTAKAVALGFIANELITNAMKYGEGPIIVRLVSYSDGRNTLSVSNDGPALPLDFDPAASKGLGMKIIQSFVRKIGGKFRFERLSENKGARFSVLFHLDLPALGPAPV